jgi:hypothetical protein
MKRWLAAALLFGFALPAWAVGTLIPAASRVDMVYDDSRGLVYISNGSQVLRYDPATNAFLSPIDLGGQLGGIDISPDNHSLVVADQSDSVLESRVHLVDLDSLTQRTVSVATPDSYEGGTYTAVYDANGKIYTTSTYNGSGWVEMRRLDPATGSWVDLASVRQNTMLSASGDGETIAFAENNMSTGAWGLIDVPTGAIIRRQGSDGTGWTLYEIATDRFGAQFSIPTYGGTMVYDDAYAKLATIGAYAGVQPIGVAYHPVERIAYFPNASTSEVRVFDMNSRTQTGTLNFEYTFTSSNNNHAFVDGRTRLSRDGSLLMVSVGGGVRIYQQYAPLQAAYVSATANIGQAKTVTLAGSIGNGGALAYSLGTAPAHGTAVLSNNTVTYTPTAGFVGNDAFTYRVQYGRVLREATVAMTVVDPNHAPVAVNDSARARNTAILIPVLANDSDPDGDALSIVMVTQPVAGSVSIQGSQLRFVPPKKWPSNTLTFNYTISDGRGKQATAMVTVTRF